MMEVGGGWGVGLGMMVTAGSMLPRGCAAVRLRRNKASAGSPAPAKHCLGQYEKRKTHLVGGGTAEASNICGAAGDRLLNSSPSIWRTFISDAVASISSLARQPNPLTDYTLRAAVLSQGTIAALASPEA